MVMICMPEATTSIKDKRMRSETMERECVVSNSPQVSVETKRREIKEFLETSIYLTKLLRLLKSTFHEVQFATNTNTFCLVVLWRTVCAEEGLSHTSE